MRISTEDLVRSYINSQRGWAVADQFSDSFNGEPFEEQNYNALLYIREIIMDLVDGDVLSDDALSALEFYYKDLTTTLFCKSVISVLAVFRLVLIAAKLSLFCKDILLPMCIYHH